MGFLQSLIGLILEGALQCVREFTRPYVVSTDLENARFWFSFVACFLKPILLLSVVNARNCSATHVHAVNILCKLLFIHCYIFAHSSHTTRQHVCCKVQLR